MRKAQATKRAPSSGGDVQRCLATIFLGDAPLHEPASDQALHESTALLCWIWRRWAMARMVGLSGRRSALSTSRSCCGSTLAARGSRLAEVEEATDLVTELSESPVLGGPVSDMKSIVSRHILRTASAPAGILPGVRLSRRSAVGFRVLCTPPADDV